MTREEKQMRRFSDSFKKEKVALIEKGKITVIELSRLYEVSRSAVYRWIRKYGLQSTSERMVIEKDSEGSKTKELLERIKLREQEIGRQQIQIRYLEEVIEYWDKELGKDLKKK